VIPINDNYDLKISRYINEVEYAFYPKTIEVGKKKSRPVHTVKTKEQAERDKRRSKMSSIQRTKSSVYKIARANVWDWFITLTFNPEKVDSFDYDLVTKKMSNWLRGIKSKNPDMIYLGVPEKHDSGRWHFHFVFGNINAEQLGLVDSGKTVKEHTIYNIGKYKLGWSTATEVISSVKVSTYITKYITKDNVEVSSSKRRFWSSKNVNKPEVDTMIMEDTLTVMKQLMIQDNFKHVSQSTMIINDRKQYYTYIQMGIEKKDN